MKKYAIAVGTLVLLITTVLGASAFTSSELTRSATIGVEADNNAIISLSPGTVGDAVTIDGNDQLSIDATPGSASGVNVGAKFSYGNDTAPTSSYAFSITNSDSQTRDYNVAYQNVQNLQGQSGAANFTIYDSAGNQVDSVTPGSDATFTANSGETHYVVLKLDTTGLDSNADLSGDLRISA